MLQFGVMSATSHTKQRVRKSKRGYVPSAIDSWVYLAIIIGPICTIPQIISIWQDHNKGVSVISWVAYLVAAIIWLLYGLKRKDSAIITVELIWIVLSLLIIIGISR